MEAPRCVKFYFLESESNCPLQGCYTGVRFLFSTIDYPLECRPKPVISKSQVRAVRKPCVLEMFANDFFTKNIFKVATCTQRSMGGCPILHKVLSVQHFASLKFLNKPSYAILVAILIYCDVASLLNAQNF